MDYLLEFLLFSSMSWKFIMMKGVNHVPIQQHTSYQSLYINLLGDPCYGEITWLNMYSSTTSLPKYFDIIYNSNFWKLILWNVTMCPSLISFVICSIKNHRHHQSPLLLFFLRSSITGDSRLLTTINRSRNFFSFIIYAFSCWINEPFIYGLLRKYTTI